MHLYFQEQEKFNTKLDTQRDRQQKALQKKLEERLRQKEAHLTRMQDQQVRESTQGSSTGLAAKLRRAALLSKHMMEKERFRYIPTHFALSRMWLLEAMITYAHCLVLYSLYKAA